MSADCTYMYDTSDGKLVLPPSKPNLGTLMKPVIKDTNPKDMRGVKKAPISSIPTQVISEVGVAMLEGALKYGRHNYRHAGVRASVYYDATMRHITQWWEIGENIDKDSGMHHITKAIASLCVLRDAMINDMCTDDRPPSTKNFYPELDKKVEELLEKYKDYDPIHYNIEDKMHVKE